MDDYAAKQVHAQLSDRLQALAETQRPLAYDEQVLLWSQSARWMERDLQNTDDLIQLLEDVLATLEA
jgi:hypothetical protein